MRSIRTLSVALCWLISSPPLVTSCSGRERSAERAADSASSPAAGLILQEAEGERRVRRPRPGPGGTLGPFIIKLDERNGGSTDLFLGYEDLPPGAEIPPHHHPGSGEILFIHKGTGVASVGSRQGAVGPGATIYIPQHTRVSLRNTGAEALTIAFIFPGEGIGEYLRETSVLEGDSAEPLSADEIAAIRERQREHITFDSVAGAGGRGLILQASEGERRVRRPLPGGVRGLTTSFIIKVDSMNGGSPDLVMIYQDVVPGEAIAPHVHPSLDEILFIQRGSGVVSLGTREAPVTAGGTVYLPPNTRIALRNTGKEPLTMFAVFGRPGFEAYLREVSVPDGKKAAPLSAEELSTIRARHREHVIYDRP